MNRAVSSTFLATVVAIISVLSFCGPALGSEGDFDAMCTRSIVWNATCVQVEATQLHEIQQRCVTYAQKAPTACVEAMAAFADCVEGKSCLVGTVTCAYAASQVDDLCVDWRDEIVGDEVVVENEAS